MRYKKLGRTGIRASVIGYGGIKLPLLSQDLANATMDRALDLGVNFIDTARNYGDSERKIGVATRGGRDDFYIATKTSRRTAKGAREELSTSLRQLGMDRIDLWQLHTVSDLADYQQVTGPGGALEAMRWAQEKGLVDHVGITIHRDLGVMRLAADSGEFETVMLAYSIIDQEHVGAEILPLCGKKRLGVIVMKPLCGGALAMPRAQDEPKPKHDAIVRASLRHVISNRWVTTAIPGIQSVEEVEEDCAVGRSVRALSLRERRRSLRLIGTIGASFRYGQRCLRCGYCLPCPNGIAIPDVFRALDEYQGYPGNVRSIGLETYRSLKVRPDACAECRRCVRKCPSGIDIPAKLKQAQIVLDEAIRSAG